MDGPIRNCEGVKRRDFLKLGLHKRTLLVILGLRLAQCLDHSASGQLPRVAEQERAVVSEGV